MVSLAILYSIQFTFGLRVSELDEKLGLDITTHGEVIDNPEELIWSKKKTLEIVEKRPAAGKNNKKNDDDDSNKVNRSKKAKINKWKK